MKLSILYFTEGGRTLAEKLCRLLPASCEKPSKGELYPRVEWLFHRCDALIFIGACGIAVRAIAPLVVSKARDPAVIVMDEKGEYVIPLLSGHMGGANALARQIAAHMGAAAVITTATDVNGRFSADAWAARRGLIIDSMDAAKTFSAQILLRDLPFCTDLPCGDALPDGIFRGDAGDCGMAVSCRSRWRPFGCTLHIIPPIIHIGIGCRRGTPDEKIQSAIAQAVSTLSIDPRAVRAIASIDLKKDEDGLLRCADTLHLPLRFYSAQALAAMEGAFSGSAYVQRIVGVDNVCERAACKSAGEGARLLLPKTVVDGVTVAAAQEKWSVAFD